MILQFGETAVAGAKQTGKIKIKRIALNPERDEWLFQEAGVNRLFRHEIYSWCEGPNP